IRSAPAVCDSSNPPAAVTQFLTTDTQAALWFYVKGVKAGDVFSSSYYTPSGAFYAPSSGPWDPSAAGDRCFNDTPVQIVGGQAASLPGTWTVKVTLNGVQVFQLTFDIVATSGGGGGSTSGQVTNFLMTRAPSLDCSVTPPSVTRFLSTDSQAMLW